jgi:toxin ParE1/3/4
MTLIWSPESIHDLVSLRAYIAENDPAAAKHVALHILYGVDHLLAANPKLGRPGRVPGTRELVIPDTPYIIPYRVRGTTIEIVRIYHSARRWPERRRLHPGSVNLLHTTRYRTVLSLTHIAVRRDPHGRVCWQFTSYGGSSYPRSAPR